jgi:hypothetical protein
MSWVIQNNEITNLAVCQHTYVFDKGYHSYWIQHYVIKFVSYLQQVGGFLLVLRFPPPIKLIATI